MNSLGALWYTNSCNTYEFSITTQENLCCLGGYFCSRSTLHARLSDGSFLYVLNNDGMHWRISLRLGMVALLAAGGYLGYKSWEEHERNARIQSEIALLEAEAAKVRRENETLAQKIEYFASPDFQEQEAKKKLGLRRQEESVIALHETSVFSPEVGDHGDSQLQRVYQERNSDTTPNYRKWWRRFFE